MNEKYEKESVQSRLDKLTEKFADQYEEIARESHPEIISYLLKQKIISIMSHILEDE